MSRREHLMVLDTWKFAVFNSYVFCLTYIIRSTTITTIMFDQSSHKRDEDIFVELRVSMPSKP